MHCFIVAIVSAAALPLGAQQRSAAHDQYEQATQYANQRRYAEAEEAYTVALDQHTGGGGGRVGVSQGSPEPEIPANPEITLRVSVYVFTSVQIWPGDLFEA